MSVRTIVELDLVGFSDIARQLEENLNSKAVADLQAQIQEFVKDALRCGPEDGKAALLKTTGDGAILSFDNPAHAHAFATEVQHSTERHNSKRTLRESKRWFRVGIATGDLHQSDIGDNYDFAGTVISKAVRLEAAARPGEIVVDASTYSALPAELQAVYGAQEIIEGKRGERLLGRRCAVVPREKYRVGLADHRTSLQALSVTAHPRVTVSLVACLIAFLVTSFVWLSQQHTYRPPSAHAQWWYEQGVAALREGTYLKAANALKQAVANDVNFALAHARLADAYNELDQYGDAYDELVQARDLSQHLRSLDGQYLEAIQATVRHNFKAALQDYRAILRDVPDSAKADGYIDLGRAFEKVGDLPHAIESYSAAANRAPQYAAAFLRIAILEGRQNHTVAANAAFKRAEQIYRVLGNAEGRAEIAYQQGSIAASNYDFVSGRALLTQALQLSENLDDAAQLKARVLCRLSAIETANLRYPDGTKWAQQASSVAEAEGLSYWVTEAKIRAASASIYQSGKLSESDHAAQSALQAAERNRWPLLAADAQMALCTIRNRQGRPSEAVPLAQSALDYYSGAGYFTESTKALVLLIRAKRDRAELADAQKLCAQGLEVEKKSGSPPVMIQLEEAVGTVYFKLERYPAALSHFETAELIARQNASILLDYQVVHVADVLWRLGNYGKAEELLTSLSAKSKDKRLTSSVDSVSAAMHVTQGRYRDVLKENARVQSLDPDEVLPEVDIPNCVAELALGSLNEASRFALRALSNAQKQGDEVLVARATAAGAYVQLNSGFPAEAKALANSAQSTFARLGLWESEWQNLALLSQIATALKDLKSAEDYASKALDMVSGIEHNWGTAVYRSYVARPDVARTLRNLSALIAHQKREVH